MCGNAKATFAFVQGPHSRRNASIGSIDQRVQSPPSVFVGGVDISAACLRALCRDELVPELVVTYDETWSAASGFVDFGPLANEYGFPLLRVEDVNRSDVVDRIASVVPALIFIIGWSQLVRRPLLELPYHGTVGIHPTRLPEGRGRAPIPWTILKGLKSTACTLFFLTEGVDDGPVIDQVEVPIGSRETASTLYAKQRDAHVQLVHRNAAPLLAGEAVATPQDESKATFWTRRRPEDGRIDWSAPADQVERLIRAVTHPFPGAFADGPDGRVTFWAAEVTDSTGDEPGTARFVGRTPFIACGQGAIRVIEYEGQIRDGMDLAAQARVA